MRRTAKLHGKQALACQLLIACWHLLCRFNSLAQSQRRYIGRDVSQLDEEEEFDLITAFDAIHDQAKPDVVLREISAALRPQGYSTVMLPALMILA